MIVINSMTNVTIPETLGLSVLGLLVVFLVLVFLMAIIYIMTAVIRKASKKPVAVAGDAAVSAAPPPVDPPQLPQQPQPPQVDQISVAPAVELKSSAPKKYRVIVNGMEYEVEDESVDTVLNSTDAGSTVPIAPPEDFSAAPAAPAAKSVTSASTLEFSGVKKFKVIVDGTEYGVDAEMGDFSAKSGSGRAQ